MNDDRYATRHPGDEIEATKVPEESGRLGPYKLLNELGRGAMGVVYEAQHTQLGRRVALKVLPEELAASPDCYARFQREMQAIGRLEHPNIVLATDAGQVDGVCFIAMQLIRGVDLSKVLKDHGTLTVGQACEAVRQVAMGLHEIDSHGIIHRDIKPSNLLLAGNGEVKILDLGIASLRQGSSFGDKLTMTGGFLGTPDYVAPEQVVNQGPLDIRADIYSLGCTLYHLLCGHAPFSGPQYNSFPAKLLGHSEHEPEPLDTAALGIPPELLDVIRRMMAKNRDERFAKPKELADALEPFCDPESLDAIAQTYGTTTGVRGRSVISASDDTKTLPAPRAARSQRGANRSFALVTAVVALALLSYAGWWLLNPPGDDSNTVADLAQETTTNVADDPPEAEPTVEVDDDQQPIIDSTTDIAENTRVIAEEAKKLSSAAADVVDSNQAVAENTERIALTLDQMQAQFGEALKSVHQDPQTPTEWYANALIHAKSGNQLEGRRAYLKFFTFDLNVIDPYMNFAQLLRLQEGTAGALETFRAIPGDPNLPARRFTDISLQPADQRRELLQELVREHPDFGPAYLSLAETFEGEHSWVQTLTLLDKVAKKSALDDYLAADARGHVLKYYLDQSQAGERLETAQTLQKNFAAVTQQTVDNPVSLTWFHNLGDKEIWLDFTFAENAAEPEFRFSRDDDFTGFELPQIDLPAATRSLLPIGQHGITEEDFDGTLVMTTHLEVPNSRPESVMEVQYKDRNGVARGPFEFEFSPEQMMVADALASLHRDDKRPDWIEFRPSHEYEEREFPEFDVRHETTEIWFTGFLQHGWRGVKSVRYGLNVDVPDTDFPNPNADYDRDTKSKFYLSLRTEVRHVVLQVTFVDGTDTGVLRFENKKTDRR